MPTIFFEHPTLGEFARYLVDQYRAVFAERFAPAASRCRSSVDAGYPESVEHRNVAAAQAARAAARRAVCGAKACDERCRGSSTV